MCNREERSARGHGELPAYHLLQKYHLLQESGTIMSGHASVSRTVSVWPRLYATVSFVLLMGCLIWTYWPATGRLVQRWSRDAEYSHGYLVPVVALVWLWYRRKQLSLSQVRPSWWGIAVLALTAAMILTAEYLYYDYVETLSLLVCLAGLTLLLGGWHLLRWSWPAIAFLFLMIPLPELYSELLADPLQQLATQSSTYVLQTIGLPAVAEGNTIILKTATIGIVEACSGLRMLVFFFAASTAVAMFAQRVMWEKVLIVLSAIPIALISNLVRIVVTGLLHEYAGSEIADKVFHDLAGVLMTPLALGMLLLEMKMLKHLLVPPLSGPVLS